MQQRFHLAYGLIYWPLLGVTLFSPTQRRLVIVQVVHRKPMIRVRSGWISTAIAGLKAHDEVKCDAAALKRVRSSTVATGDDLVIIRNNAIWKSLNFFQGPIYARRLLKWGATWLFGPEIKTKITHFTRGTTQARKPKQVKISSNECGTKDNFFAVEGHRSGLGR